MKIIFDRAYGENAKIQMDDSDYLTIIIASKAGPIGVVLDPKSMGNVRDAIDHKIQTLIDKYEPGEKLKFNEHATKNKDHIRN